MSKLNKEIERLRKANETNKKNNFEIIKNYSNLQFEDTKYN